jgi:methionyl-tRNA formyltransferase
MNIVFFGTSDFAVIILERMLQAGMKPALVVTTQDMPAGRRKHLTPSPIKVFAEKHGLETFQPEKFSTEAIDKLQDINSDLIVLAAYGHIVPKKVLIIPKYGAINVHPSMLPKYRGPSPVQSAILAGEKETGVSIMLMDEEIDHGPILAQQKVEVVNEYYEELHNKLAELGADLLVDVIPKWINEEIKAKEQDHAAATFTKQFLREDGRIDWNQDAEYIVRQVRAFTPWPGAFTMWEGKRIKILKAHAEQRHLVIDELQMEGKSPTTLKEFILGHPNFHVGP